MKPPSLGQCCLLPPYRALPSTQKHPAGVTNRYGTRILRFIPSTLTRFWLTRATQVSGKKNKGSTLFLFFKVPGHSYLGNARYVLPPSATPGTHKVETQPQAGTERAEVWCKPSMQLETGRGKRV